MSNEDPTRRPIVKGSLLIVGGHEDKDGDALILRELVRRTHGGPLVVATVASEVPAELWDTYQRTFTRLGAGELRHLDVASRAQAQDYAVVTQLEDAAGIFFTGGDQLRITSLLGGTPAAECMRRRYVAGAVLAGTSAGASVMTSTMLVTGPGTESHRLGSQLLMAPGLGLLRDVIVDQHFAERGRIGRLLGAVAQNPAALGVGIDENTAIAVDGPQGAQRFEVMGAGAVYVVDGRDVSYSNVTAEAQDRTLSLFDVRLHVLSQGDVFDLATHRPANHPAEDVDQRLGITRDE
jgi:cyanophycinase